MTFSEEDTSRYVTVGDLRIHYNEAGAGSPLLFVHGGGPGATGWSNFHQNLQVLSENHRCILIDLPLFGKSTKPAQLSGSRFQYFADVISDFLDAIGVDRVSLVGNSMGGGTCAKFAINHPERVDKLVIMGGGGTVSFDDGKPELLGQGMVALVEFIRDPSRERAERMLSRFVHDSGSVPEGLIDERIELAMRPEIVAAQRTLFGDPGAIEDLTDQLAKITAPTLILWGREDQFIPLAAGMRYLEGIDDCEMHVFPRCGHWVMLEREESFNRMVDDFMSATR